MTVDCVEAHLNTCPLCIHAAWKILLSSELINQQIIMINASLVLVRKVSLNCGSGF